MADFMTIRRPDLSSLKWKYNHTKDKRFYKNPGDDVPIHVILGDSTYCRIKTKDVFTGKPGEPIVEGTTLTGSFTAVIASQMATCSPEKQVTMSGCSLDVLGVEDRGESSQLDVHTEFVETFQDRQIGDTK